MSTQYPSDEMIQRFAISALSKERKDEAVNEEILVGKYTGEFFIKSKEGVVLSTDIMNRYNASCETAIRIAKSLGMAGELYHLEFDNIPMPCNIEYETNIISTEPIRIENCKSLLFNFDFDEFDIVGSEIRQVSTEANVRLVVEVIAPNGFVTETLIEKSIQAINFSVLKFEGQGINIKSIEIIKDNNVFNNNAIDRTIILHNMFVSVNTL